MNLVERAKSLILTPASEWDKISSETHTVQGLYTGWIMILAAICMMCFGGWVMSRMARLKY